MKPLTRCFFCGLISLAVLVLPLSRVHAVCAQTPESPPTYQPTGLRTIIHAQPHSALVRVRYESTTPGPVQVELRNAQRRVVYTEQKRETQFVGNYDFARLPAGDYTLQVSTSGFHHVAALRLHRTAKSTATVQVIRPDAFHLASPSLFPSAATK